MRSSGRAARVVALAAAFLSFPVWAEVEVRVEARPIADPIQVFVKVTETGSGIPVTGLTADDFTVTLDATEDVPLLPANVTLPPSESDQKVSVVFTMDYTSSVTDIALVPMQDAVKAFIDRMQAGDYAAVIKFNGSQGVQVVHEFIAIDDGPADESLKLEVDESFPFQQGSGSNIYDAAVVAVEQFATMSASLPAGPKAVILITDGNDTNSNADLAGAIASANNGSIPIFSVGVAQPVEDVLTQLAVDTGGQYIPAPDEQAIADAYASIQFLLTNEYLITFDSAISDCAEHTLSVTVDPHGTDEATFTRRECDTEPNSFSFTSQTGLNTGVTARSDSVMITGIEAPGLAQVSIDVGSYSIGCGDSSTFTSANGTIGDGETICVRHTTSSSFSTSKTTTLTIGGVSAEFSTTTRAEGGGGGGGGGGGAAGVLELLLGLGMLMMRRRRG